MQNSGFRSKNVTQRRKVWNLFFFASFAPFASLRETTPVCGQRPRSVFPGFMIAPRPAQSSVEGFERNRLVCERRAFSSSVRFFALRGTRVGTRLAGR